MVEVVNVENFVGILVDVGGVVGGVLVDVGGVVVVEVAESVGGRVT